MDDYSSSAMSATESYDSANGGSHQPHPNTAQSPDAVEISIRSWDENANDNQTPIYEYPRPTYYPQAPSVFQPGQQEGGHSNIQYSSRNIPIHSPAYEDNTTGEMGNPYSSSLQIQMPTLGVEDFWRLEERMVDAGQSRIPGYDHTLITSQPENPDIQPPCCNDFTSEKVRLEGSCRLCTHSAVTNTGPTQHDFQRTEPIVEMCPHSRYRPPQYPLHATKKNSDPALQARTYQQSTTGPPMSTYYDYVASPNKPEELSEFTHCETLEEKSAYSGAWDNAELNESFY